MRQCGLGGGIGIDLGVSNVIDDDDKAIDNAGWWRHFLRLDFLVGADDVEEKDVEAADSDVSDDGDDKDAELRNVHSDADLDGVSSIPPCGV